MRGKHGKGVGPCGGSRRAEAHWLRRRTEPSAWRKREPPVCWQCRFMIQRNGSQGDSTSNRIMRMYAIDSIAIHSVDYID
jgi:hypothetical protein